MLTNSVLVIAHPDDEILWFSSILDKVDQIVFCYIHHPNAPQLGEGRLKALSQYPLRNIHHLNLTESDTFDLACWERPQLTPKGLMIDSSRRIQQSYDSNFSYLQDKLSRLLSKYTNVITHNPWGEYGHEDHVQIHCAIKSIQPSQRFKLWYNNYCSNRSTTLMWRHIAGFSNDYLSFKTNLELSRQIESLYKRNDCWTWYDDYCYFPEECFSAKELFLEPGPRAGHLFPLNMLKVDFKRNSNTSRKPKHVMTRLFKHILHRHKGLAK